MNSVSQIDAYTQKIDHTSHSILYLEELLKGGNVEITTLIRELRARIDMSLLRSQNSLEILTQYYNGIKYFCSQYGSQIPSVQAGKLFAFRPEKFEDTMTIEQYGPMFIVRFKSMQDLLHAKFARRKGSFSQDDRMSGFFRVVNIDGYSIPVCVVLSGYHEESTITHEWTHFRNNVIGSDYYSSGGGRDMYESLFYDDLQEEILAFFSEGLKRSYVQMSILHDKRYQFYMRIEGWGEAEKRRFIQDVTKYINIAREVKELRGDTYIIDLALIPLHKWYRYLLYLKKSP